MTPYQYGEWTQHWRKAWRESGYLAVADPVWLLGHQRKPGGHSVPFLNGKAVYPGDTQILVGVRVPERLR